MESSNPQAIAEELNATGDRVLNAFERRDADGVMSVYSRDLEYTQRNGVTIGWRQLANDVRKQLRSMATFKHSGFRESLKVEDNQVIEVATQEAVFVDRIFWVFRKTWNLQRRTRRWWHRTDAGWQISKVIVLEESIV